MTTGITARSRGDVEEDDPFFGPAYVDVDEWREHPQRHRYVHGGFESTDTRFSLYLPSSESYRDRFLHFLQGGVGGEEHLAPASGALAIGFAHGAAVFESNQGHLPNDLSGLRGQPDVLAFRASAQVARYARGLLADVYGSSPAHGYLLGGSGGAMRTIACLQHVRGLYDGGVAFMVNHAAYLVQTWSLMAHVEAVLRPRLPAVVAAVDHGADPADVLGDEHERALLRRLYRAGFPRGSEHLLTPVPIWVLGMETIDRADPAWYDEFWADEALRADLHPAFERVARVDEPTVLEVVAARDVPGYRAPSDDVNVMAIGRAAPDAPVGVVLDSDRIGAEWVGATIRLPDGRTVRSTGAVGRIVLAATTPDPFAGVTRGDRVAVDGRDFVAFCHHHRRPAFDDLVLDEQHSGLGSGDLGGKLLLLQHAGDRECWPPAADWFARLVAQRAGGAADDTFRLWWVENAAHFVPVSPAGRTRNVDYGGCVRRAVADLLAWVEERRPPVPSTGYRLDEDGALVLPGDVAVRGGIQPVVEVQAEGRRVVEVEEGVPVEVVARVDVPAGSGPVVRAEWDLDGRGRWEPADVERIESGGVRAVRTVSFAEPGSHRVTLRAFTAPHGVENLGAAHVVVRPAPAGGRT